ncbi:MAG: hypothetical protein JO166_11665 [Deltaproteobacteria bacterium]|nr:hypothetical protein [Deltaproteobacteria bacterium]
MDEEQFIPRITIAIDRQRHCWCVKLGSHLIPIRQGVYAENVDALVVASEIKSLAVGPVVITTES